MRVWLLKLAPESSAVHRHELDHLLIQVSGDRIAVIPEPDSEGPFSEDLAADVVPGAVVRSLAAAWSRRTTSATRPTSRSSWS